MIVVSVFLRSAIHSSRDRELARMVIANDGGRWTYTDDPTRDPHEEWEPVYSFQPGE